MKPHKFYFASIILVAAASTLTGCGGSSADDPDSAPPVAQTNPASATASIQTGTRVVSGVG